MIYSVKKYLNHLFPVIIFITLFFNCNYHLFAQPFKLAGISDIVRFFEDGYNKPVTYDSLVLFGIRGEILSGL